MNVDRLAKLREMELQKPDDPFLKFAIAQELVSRGDNVRAEGNFTNLLLHYPHYIATYYQFGKLLESQQRNQEACETYRKGIREANAARDLKTASELKEALNMIEEDDE